MIHPFVYFRWASPDLCSGKEVKNDTYISLKKNGLKLKKNLYFSHDSNWNVIKVQVWHKYNNAKWWGNKDSHLTTNSVMSNWSPDWTSSWPRRMMVKCNGMSNKTSRFWHQEVLHGKKGHSNLQLLGLPIVLMEYERPPKKLTCL